MSRRSTKQRRAARRREQAIWDAQFSRDPMAHWMVYWYGEFRKNPIRDLVAPNNKLLRWLN